MAVETVAEIFETRIPRRLEKKPELVAQIAASYRFDVSGDEACHWVVDLKKEGGEVRSGTEDVDCVITMTGDNLLALVNGKLNGQMAFMTGKLKVKGNMGLAMKLSSLLG